MVAEGPLAAPAHGRRVVASLAALDGLPESCDGIAVFVYRDERPLQGVAALIDWRLCGSLSRALARDDFSGDAREVMLLPCRGRLGRRRLFVLGLGPQAALTAEALAQALAEAERIMRRAGVTAGALAAPAAWAGDGALLERAAQLAPVDALLLTER